MTEHTEHTEQRRSPARAGGRHPVDVGHLVMGLAFLGLFLVWCLFETGTVETDNVHWLLPFPWVLAGIAGLVAAVASNRRRSERERWALSTDTEGEQR